MKQAGFITTLILSFTLGPSADARTVHRILRKYVDMGKVQPLFMVAGMETVVTFPCAVQEMGKGSPDVQVKTSKVEPRRIFLKLASGHAEVTDLHIFCDRDKSVTFDIIANSKINQDQVIIQGLYGSPAFEDEPVLSTEVLDDGPSSLTQSQSKTGLLFRMPAIEGAGTPATKTVRRKNGNAS